jgi:hypothetical protein
MNILRRRRPVSLFLVVATLILASFIIHSADTLPARLTDDEFWKLVETYSEPSGSFLSENFTSNENGFQKIIPALLQSARQNGVYLGVGPEQNFTYIVAIRPKIAFIIDIRRQNLLEHLMYKAIFEMADDRADFLSILFSCKRPSGLTNDSSIDSMLDAYLRAYQNGNYDGPLFRANLQSIKERLAEKHGFKLDADEFETIEHVYSVFNTYGPQTNYTSNYPAVSVSNLNSNFQGTNFTTVMVATDPAGRQLGFLASEENYRLMRDFEMKNLVVPVVGDFGGPTALRAVGQYLKDHSATVSAFYTSNVEQYLFQPIGMDVSANRGIQLINGGARNFYSNVATLPIDETSVFIRSGTPNLGGTGPSYYTNSSQIAPILATLNAFKTGVITSYPDIFKIRKPE